MHPQDWLLVVEALIRFAGNPRDLETPREERAYEIAEAIAAEQGLDPSEALQQINDEWSGPP
ncbi:hypothetical protein HTIA_p2819 (plasmid) [Halorhabdus tiamatea SARL4B]|uniref:Uncharacterized protein n=1 Tax=Halorhabdus tiamatea SARL4B TaxID=1033806 RepID=S6D9B5_9EURY|nr:hypothetical protein HTIA_p2819 [Halorhabdus tiamatea SARL4B]